MPELPEIETLARKLRKSIKGKLVESVSLSGLPLRRPVPAAFAKNIQGRTIRRIIRRGKYLVLELHPRAYWLIHLGMSGRLLYHPFEFPGTKHTHAVIRFSDGSELQYRDPRRFGLMDIYEVSSLRLIPELRTLGREPLGSGFDDSWLKPLLIGSGREVKSFLLDQNKVAGLGNIYVCEALFMAGLHPERRCNTLSAEEVSSLVAAVRRVLSRAVRLRGTSFSDFIDLDGNPGKNQNYLNVFQRNGKACMRCGNSIQRIRQGNRSTFFCADCQK
ncbi:MAG: bifunctional DNA-formamidopyrimidine glycosylase/DNA-(apurinic or apyrimidinic site) lyase [Acidobacteriota bacterium]